MDTNGNITTLPLSKTLLFEQHQYAPSSDTRSEASSVASEWSDINSNFALQLGVNKEDLKDERFKIDRQKLENMIKDGSAIEGKNAAEYFFDEIKKSTGTHISWPCRLKINAKTKKDPHVRIVGLPNDVARAKERVLSVLDSRGSRVIMKMDISHTDHSYIIGRQGNIIKRIMETTATHIHFPDSNRSPNSTEKSNQVSLCGSLEGVEKARAQVRSSTPLVISFELPVVSAGRMIPDGDTQYVKDVQDKFNVQVIFSTRVKLHSSLVLVKGSEKEAARVQEATQLLINFMCDNIASQILVNLQLEISPHHHDIVKGKNNEQLMQIMEQTNTKIIFPDLNDVNIKPIKKSQVTITGTIDGVYKAKQRLIGNLPVALIFDYPDNSSRPDDALIESLNFKHGVHITQRVKSRQSTLSIVIKGVEKYVGKIYEARHELLGLTTPLVKGEIPTTYFSQFPMGDQDLGSLHRCDLVEILSSFPQSPLTPGVGHAFPPNFPSTPNQSFANRPMPPNPNDLSRMPYMTLSPANLNRMNLNHALQQQLQQANNPGAMTMPPYSSVHQSVSPRSAGTNTSGYLSNSFHGSTNSLEQYGAPYRLPTMQVNGNNVGSFPQSENQIFGNSSGGNISLMNLNESGGNRSFDMDNCTLTPNFALTPRLLDYDNKRIEGFKAMKRVPQTPEVRTPTSAWAGLALSKTSPFALGDGMSQLSLREKLTPFDKASTTGFIDSMPASMNRIPLSDFKDIHSLLTYLKLEHYISNFVINEVDMEMFASLTADNLTEMGITAFGPRKRLMLAIDQLKSENLRTLGMGRFGCSAAPGAERRPSVGDW